MMLMLLFNTRIVYAYFKKTGGYTVGTAQISSSKSKCIPIGCVRAWEIYAKQAKTIQIKNRGECPGFPKVNQQLEAGKRFYRGMPVYAELALSECKGICMRTDLSERGENR